MIINNKVILQEENKVRAQNDYPRSHNHMEIREEKKLEMTKRNNRIVKITGGKVNKREINNKK